jgi:alpha-galactosidase
MLSNGYRYVLTVSVSAFLAFGINPVSAQDAAVLRGATAPENAVWLDSLDLSKVTQGWGQPQAGHSVDLNALTIHGKKFVHGFGTHADSELWVDLQGAVTKFVSYVGVDSEVQDRGSIRFEVWADGKKIADSGLMRGGQEAKLISVDVAGVKQMTLIVSGDTDGINYDHADWAGAMFLLSAGATIRPATIDPPASPPPPIVHPASARPAIHGPQVVGSTPHRPFQFLIAATGDPPLTFAAQKLPAGLKLDTATGIITGALEAAGETEVELTVKNASGQASRKLTIVGGDHKLALTPPLGWNSWNCWAGAVSDKKVRAAADAMVSSGLAAHGFQYINIDDCWEGQRNAQGEIQTNERFPDMKGLADYVHSKGLKLGIYSSPGPKTCAGYEGSWQHEEQDARTYARWGIDYLKYDWCSYGTIAGNPDLAGMQKPYRVMQKALDDCGRDIVYSMCQYGMGRVWEWGEQVGGNCWRTTGDITDNWGSMSGIGFGESGHEKFAGPGHWNDPDMLVVGLVGWGPSLHPSKLRPHEQVTHISLWCLISAPLLIGCDMSRLDEFTLALLTNDEVLDVNQDPLGRPAGRVKQQGSCEIWARPLCDGTLAVGLFNRGFSSTDVQADWSDLKLEGRQSVRDLWLHKDLGEFDGHFSANVPPHGTVLVKIGAARK